MRSAILLTLISTCLVSAQGMLTPSAAPGPMMKTLEQIEPRTPIASPTSIFRSGSYYLTTNIVASGHGIIVSANQVTLDLNGFTIFGGTGSGVLLTGTRTNVVVRNGVIRDFGASGVSAMNSLFTRLENLIVTGNTNDGIITGSSTIVSDCVAHLNVDDGIEVAGASQVLRCTALTNGGSGIVVGHKSKVLHCYAAGNAAHGIQLANTAVTVDDSQASDNLMTGIHSTVGGHIVRNSTALDNKHWGIDLGACCNMVLSCHVAESGYDGVRVPGESTASDNICRSNGASTNNGAGIRVSGGGSHVEHNRLIENDVGIAMTSHRNVIIRNSLSDNATNFSLGSTPIIGPLITTNSVSITNVNPWANFVF